MFDIKKVRADAEKELREEREKAATVKIKDLLAKIDKAQAVVRSLERDLELTMAEIGDNA